MKDDSGRRCALFAGEGISGKACKKLDSEVIDLAGDVDHV